MWGLWGIPEDEVGFFPDLEGAMSSKTDAGRDTSRRGSHGAAAARLVWTTHRHNWRRPGVSRNEHDLRFPLVHGIAEHLPFRDESFDVVVSEYGAAIWSDPYRWIPEAARVLRPGGDLVFMGNSGLLMMIVEDDEDVPPAARCCATTSACIASTGRTTTASSFTSATETGFGCCGRTDSRSSTSSSRARPKVRRPPIHS